MKYILLFVLVFILTDTIQSQNLDYLNEEGYDVSFDVSYGEYDRNRFDIILPASEFQHGLVIFIHGGGFKNGDKSAIYNRKEDIRYFIQNNIAVASINYRFRNYDDSMGVRLCLHDIKRAIQYLRFHATEYNIDKERIACYGISAGAGSALYFAFHDDMAVHGDTTLLGESTRMKCAAAIATQATYNVFRCKKIIPFIRVVTFFQRRQWYNAAANFYGYPDYKSFKDHREEITESLDMLNMIDDQDPPVYLMNLLSKTFPKNKNIIYHHRQHAIAVAEKLSQHGVEYYLYTNKQVEEEKDINFKIREFMVQHLGVH